MIRPMQANLSESLNTEVTAIHQRLEIGLERVLLDTARCACADPRRLLNEDGSTKAPHELDDDIKPAIEGIEVTEVREGASMVRTYKYRLASRSAAHSSLKRYLRTLTADNDGSGDEATNALAEAVSLFLRATAPGAHEGVTT